jgi:hypothetical protein
MIIWNPWHGCHKVSEGCQHCYMYFLDRMRGIDTSKVSRNANFDMPLKRGRDGRFKVAPGMELLVGLSTDFFVEEADAWRDEAWAVIRKRPDVVFRILTKRAGRIRDHLPADWGDGYENVMLQVTTENQTRADERLSVLLDVPAKHKGFMAAPLIGPVDAERYLAGVPHPRQTGAEPTGVPFGLELPGQDAAVQTSSCGRVALRRADCFAHGRVPRNLRHMRLSPHLQRVQQLRRLRELTHYKIEKLVNLPT